MTATKNLKLREGKWHLRRRVPKRYHPVEVRNEVVLSLKTDSLEVAQRKMSDVWELQIEAWEAKLAGDTSDADRKHAAAMELAAVRGVRYMPIREVSDLPIEKVLERVEAASDHREAVATLGAAPAPLITISKALDAYFKFVRDETLGKSRDQLRRWRNPRKKAVKNFIHLCGDKPIIEITRDDMLDFREWWLEKIIEEELTPNSGNKDLGHLGQVLQVVNDKKGLGIDLGSVLGKLKFKEGEQKTRPPFSSKWIEERILAPGALDGLNNEARCIVLAMVNTGARPSELTTLNESTICLDADVPHIKIRPDGRQVKSPNAKRDIPLVGVSLEAMRECPRGFPRYFDKPGVSGTINNFLSDNDLRETPEHSLYSLRHSFEDRLLRANVDYRIRKDLMGQRMNGERYGVGAMLDQEAELIAEIAF
ncbi:MAG: DUF6538 domain-containing protein [Pseudomonadota bacterium]